MNMLAEIGRAIGNARAVPVPDHDPDAVSFGEETPEADAEVRNRMRRPIRAGIVVTVGLVFGLLIWASVASVSGAVLAAGTVRVENNSKQIRHLESGIIRQIFVHEGQRVRRGQLLMRFDDVQVRSAEQIYQAAVDAARAQIARFQAEAANAPDVVFPPELTSRASEPQIGMLLAGQRNLYQSRMMLYRSQAAVMRGQAAQLQTQIVGMRAQAAATRSQSALIADELQGVVELNRQGYAPRSRMLALQRNAAGLTGQAGSVMSDIARTQQAIGEAQIQVAQLDEKRQTEAAEGLRTAQEQLTEAAPKLAATQAGLAQANVRAPVEGYVFDLTQFTEGGVAAGGEKLMEIVPVNTRLVITARVRPTDISDVRVGMPALVTLSAYNPRTTPQINGTVTLVSADATIDEATRETYYTVQVMVTPEELAKAGKGKKLSPGMPAMVSIVTGSRTIIDYLLGPIVESMRLSLRER